MCVCCQDEAETNGHIFWGCPRAQEAWVASKVHLLPQDTNIDSLQDLFWHEMMTKAAGDEKCSQLVMIVWALWCNRNEVYHGGSQNWNGYGSVGNKLPSGILVCN